MHPKVARRLREWLKTKPGLELNDLLFPMSGRGPGGTEHKTDKDDPPRFASGTKDWLNKAKTKQEKVEREQSDFLSYCNHDGLYADFHANRHLFSTSLKQAGLSPKMAQTLARHSDIRLTLGVYTHVGLHDRRLAIAALPGPPCAKERGTQTA